MSEEDGGVTDKSAELEAKNEELTKRLQSLEEKQNDPNYIASLHKAHFGEPEPQKPAEDSDPMPEFEKLDVDNMTNEQIVTEMERRNRLLMEWQSRQTDKKFSQRDQEALAREEAEQKEREINAIRAFRDKTPDFDEFKDQIREVYGTMFNIEDAYNFVKWGKLAKEAEATGGVRRPAMKASASTEQDNMNKTFDSVEAGAKSAFDEVTQGVDLSIL